MAETLHSTHGTHGTHGSPEHLFDLGQAVEASMALSAVGPLLPTAAPAPLSLIQSAALRRRASMRAPVSPVASASSLPTGSIQPQTPLSESLSTASVAPMPPASTTASMGASIVDPVSSPASSIVEFPVFPMHTSTAASTAEPVISQREEPHFSDLERALPPVHAALAAQALRVLAGPQAQVQTVGPRPAHERSIFKRIKHWIKAGVAVGALAISVGALHSTPSISIQSLPPMLSSGIPASVGALAASNQLPGLSTLIPALSSAAAGPVVPGPLSAAVGTQAHTGDTSLIELPITLDANNPMDDQELSMALLPKDSFMALVVRVERLRLKVYYDPHENIGGGYCIDVREAVYGKDRVRQDFQQAGLDEKQIQALLSHKRKDNMTVTLTQEQALRLVMITKSDYRELARNTIGGKIFDHLSPDRQNTLTYLAYNSNIARYKQLPQAIAKGRDLEAMSEMVPAFRNGPDQPLQMNYRLGSYLWAGWMGKLHDAIANPMHHEGLYANADGLNAFSRAYGLTGHGAHKSTDKAIDRSTTSSASSTSLADAHLANTHLEKGQLAARLNTHRKTHSGAQSTTVQSPRPMASPSLAAMTSANTQLSTASLSGSRGVSARLAAQREQAAVGADALAVSGRSLADRNLQGF